MAEAELLPIYQFPQDHLARLMLDSDADDRPVFHCKTCHQPQPHIQKSAMGMSYVICSHCAQTSRLNP